MTVYVIVQCHKTDPVGEGGTMAAIYATHELATEVVARYGGVSGIRLEIREMQVMRQVPTGMSGRG